MRITEKMVRRFCEAKAIEENGIGVDCDGEYHEAIRAGLRAVFAGVGEECAPRFCTCEHPVPDTSYYNRCKATVDNPGNRNICCGFIKGVTQRRDGRKK